MPERKPRSEWTTEDYRDRTENGRRLSRFKAAEERIRRIVDGSPPLTEQQLSALAVLLHGGSRAQG